MKTKTIFGTVTASVALDAVPYGRYLTIAASGEVAPAAAGANGIAGPSSVTNDRVENLGTVLGGLGASATFAAYDGGAGIDLSGGGRVTNHGIITGGAGGIGYFGGDGGAGVALGGIATVANFGTITGGAAGDGSTQYGGGGNGGAGVDLTAGGTLTNRGIITGGGAGTGFYPADGGAGVALGASGTVTNWGTITGGANFRAALDGGVGVNLAAGTLLNNGRIEGGLNADAVQIQQTGTLRNTGTITGGTGGAFGVLLDAAGKATNFGLIAGGAGTPSASGGYGMLFRGAATLANYGTLAGGAGNANTFYGGTGGIALDLETSGTVLNAGTIEGGAGGPGDAASTGGLGVQLQSGATLTNFGTIAGGQASADGDGQTAFNHGGMGVYVFGDSRVVNHGRITGGNSAYGGYGVRLSGASATLLNTGTIEGGVGATTGGIGIAIDGTTVTNEGTIAGGLGAGGVRADAVQFGFYGGTLIITPDAVFEGAIQGSNYANNTILLAGDTAGTLSGLGTNITGITNFVEDAHARWTLGGTLTGTGAADIGADARLTLNGASSIATIAFAAGGYGTLTLDQPTLVTSVLAGFSIGDKIDLSDIQATSFKLSHDTLTLFNAAHAVVDTLHFSGHLTGNDFYVYNDGKNTDIVYAGPGRAAAPPAWLHAGLPHG